MLRKLLFFSSLAIVLILGALGTVWYFLFAAPDNLVINEPRIAPNGAAVIVLEPGMSLTELSMKLEEMHVIKSSETFLSFVQKMNLSKKVKQGIYVFNEPMNLFSVLGRLAKSDYGYTPVKVTIPEGYTIKTMSTFLPTKLVDITPEDFLSASDGLEGMLFPDTYFFYPYATSTAVIEMMTNNFEKKIKPLEADIASSSRSLKEIITMASILEKEVQTETDKQMVSDLFWRRIAIGMPLQADSTLTFYKGKTSEQLTINDLTEEMAYNSYTNKGLPPGPISNPGIVSIKAALYPLSNEYLFFLSDKEGTTHFSKTYAEHLRLKKKYLP